MSDSRVAIANQMIAWNETAVDFPPLPLPALLRHAATTSPDAVALRDSAGVLTYAELIDQIHRVAWYLKRRGVDRGACVASSMPRGSAAILVQAAIFAVSAIYVPIDAAHPPALLTGLLADIDADFLIALREHEITATATRIDLDDPLVRQQIVDQAADPLGEDPALDDTAYVIHTSGTSGRPKPVAVSHRALANSTLARLHRYTKPITGFALISPMTFDSSLAGIWWTLLRGGELRLLSPDTSTALSELAIALSSGGISHTLLTPSLYRTVLSTVDKPSSGLRQIVVAGEACPPELVSEHYRVMPDVELVNEYGPTEAAVWCASATLLPGADVVVGTPVANTELWILDSAGQLVAPGEFGEVCVAGANLADGYLGDPELTSARFVPHPLDSERVLYRTGDLGRWRADGQLELRGRLDNQVKVRGYRVEPDGVATVLRTHPGVRDAVVLAVQGGLAAYVVPEWDERSAADELRQRWTSIVDDLDQHDERSGWTSSYTGARLSEEDMDEWVASTLDLAGEGSPGSVLDLGCGTGQVLTELARRCGRVVGVDASKPALDALAARLDAAGLGHVTLRQGDALATDSLSDFDLVLCNSVTQYFPGEDYLTEVVTGALNSAVPDGRVVLGDVRDLGLHDAFHAAVVLAAADDGVPITRLRERWRGRLERDPQLLVDPRWFTSTIRGKHVEVRPRRGRKRNEMNDFRFDVVVSSAPATEIAGWQRWPGDLAGLRTLLTGTDPVGVLRIPNQRTAGACAVRSRLAGADHNLTAVELRQLAAEAEQDAVHPAELTAVAAEVGWTVRISRAAGWPSGELDAVFLPPGNENLVVRWPEPQRGGGLVSAPVRRHVIMSATERLVPALREQATTLLAEHERPATYVVLTELPLTAHGKLDRAALPVPSAERPALSTPYVRPVRPDECRVAEILAEVLGIDRVGLHDDFVELGGDSLLAVRAAVRLGDHFGVALPIRTVFDVPTVAGLAATLADAPRVRPPAAPEVHEHTLPLSLPQMLLWGHDLQLGTGMVPGPDCTLVFHYRIRGPLDTAALSAAVDQLVARHEALRVSVHLEPELANCYQVINPPGSGVLETVADLSEVRPLSLTDGRVFAADLVPHAAGDHTLALRVHHLVSDGFTVDILERELSALYRGTMLPAPVSYRSVLAKPPAAPNHADVSYWATKIAGCRPIELIPPSRVDTGVEHSTQVRSLLLPASEAHAFLRFARDRKTTLYTALYTVFAAIIAADTDDRDVRLLSINAARRDADLERTVGIFLDAVLLRHQLRSDLPVTEALAAATADVNDALRHDSVPLLGLCELLPEMAAAFGQSQGIVFELLGPAVGLDLDGCVTERTDQFQEDFAGKVFQVPTYIAVIARPVADTIRLTCLYDPTYAPMSYVDRLLARMRDVMDAFVRESSRPLGELVEADRWLTAPRKDTA